MMSNEYLTPFLAAQVVGFPLAFLIRAGVRLWRSRTDVEQTSRRNRLDAAANICFAAMSIAFAFNRPLGVLLLIAGIGLTIALRRLSVTPAVYY